MNDLPPKAPERGRLLRWDQVCARLNISKAQFYRMNSAGCFISLRVGGTIRVTEASVDAYVERQILAFALENGEFVSDVS